MKTNLKSVYNDIYATIKNYNFVEPTKNAIVDSFVQLINGKILDAGCGEGVHLKRILSYGYDAFGVELSSTCCERFLKDIPHDNNDIINFSRSTTIKFNGILCMDVLEHIPYEDIDETIDSLKNISNIAMYGIANHSDILNGVELHIIQQDYNWWLRKLKLFYKNVYLIKTMDFGTDKAIFFMIYCDNKDVVDINVLTYFIGVNNSILLHIEHTALQAEHTALQAEHTALQAEHLGQQIILDDLQNSRLIKWAQKVRNFIHYNKIK